MVGFTLLFPYFRSVITRWSNIISWVMSSLSATPLALKRRRVSLLVVPVSYFWHTFYRYSTVKEDTRLAHLSDSAWADRRDYGLQKTQNRTLWTFGLKKRAIPAWKQGTRWQWVRNPSSRTEIGFSSSWNSHEISDVQPGFSSQMGTALQGWVSRIKICTSSKLFIIDVGKSSSDYCEHIHIHWNLLVS